MRLRFQLLSLLLLANSIPFLGSSVRAEEAPVRIGVLTDLSGKGAYLGQQTRIGAEIAASEINSSGKKLDLYFGDHSLDGTKAVTEAQKLLNVDHVDAVFSNFSGTSRAAAPVVQKAGRLFVYAAAAVSPVKDNTSAFKSYLDYTIGCEAIARQWKKEGVTSIGLLKAESEFGELCEIGAQKVYPGLTVTGYKIGDDVASQALVLKSKNVQAVLNASYEGDMSNMLNSFQRIQYAPRVGANEDVFTVKIIAEHPAELSGAVSFGMPQPDKEFDDAVTARDEKHDTSARDQAGMAYLHIKQLYEAIESCRSKALDCQIESILHAPKAPRFGFVRWAENRQAVYEESLKRFNEGKLEALG